MGKAHGEINGVSVVDHVDHAFSHILDGDRPGEGRIVCLCGWTSEIAPSHKLDLDVHFAEVNGISYEEQKQRTARAMRQIQGLPEIKDPKEDPKPMN